MGHVIHMLEVDDFPYREVSLVSSLHLYEVNHARSFALKNILYMHVEVDPKLHMVKSAPLSVPVVKKRKKRGTD
uniref:Uncharacterized protein n=1 Tax=Arundo donax TaxID=35708 RepID=A0A0A9EMI6_ARUDO